MFLISPYRYFQGEIKVRLQKVEMKIRKTIKMLKLKKIFAFLYELNIKYKKEISSKKRPIGIGNKKAETIFLNINI